MREIGGRVSLPVKEDIKMNQNYKKINYNYNSLRINNSYLYGKMYEQFQKK